MSDAAMQFGAVNLMTDPGTPDLSYLVDASGDGSTWGNAQAVISAIQSRLLDGSLSEISSFDNREATIWLEVRSATYDGLGAAEQALTVETRRQGYNTLTWTPSVSLAVPTVFDVVYSLLDWEFDDMSELILVRRFKLTLACLPFPRSVDEVVQESLDPPGSDVVTSIYDGSSATGWTKPAASSITSTDGKIVVTGSGVEPQWAELPHTLVTMSGDRFVFADWQADTPSKYSVVGIQAEIDGVTIKGPVAVVSSPDEPGYTRTYFEAPATWTIARFTVIPSSAGVDADVTLRVDQVSRVDAIGEETTGRQQFRSLPVAGSVRTQGRLSVEHETDSLGEFLGYIFRNDGSGYSPPLRRHLVDSDSTTPDADLISGASNMLDTLWGAEVPAQAVPDGNYRLYAALKGSGSGTVDLNISASTQIGATTLPGVIIETATVAVTNVWGIYDLTGLSLSPSKLATLAAAANAVVRVTIMDADVSGIDVEIDEAWIINLDLGALTHVDCAGNVDSGVDPGDAPAPGGPCNRIWLDSADVTNDGQDAIFIGFAADRSDAFNPGEGIKGWTPPVFDPDSMNAFVVTTRAAYPAIRFAHYPRWPHNAREVA